MADTKKKFGHALLQAFGLDDQRVKRLSLNIEAGDAPLLTVTVYPRDVSAQQIEAIATEYEIISRSELRDIRERLAAVQQAEPVQEPFALPCPTPKACREHCCSGHCIPRATSPQQAEPVAWRVRRRSEKFWNVSQHKPLDAMQDDRFEVRALVDAVDQQQAEPVQRTCLSIKAQSMIGHWLNEDMDRAVANGANSISMPDEFVEIALWLHGLAQQAEPVQPEYGSTDCVTFAGLPMTDGDRRLAAMLTQAFGADHPAIHDLVALLFAARGKQQAEPVQRDHCRSPLFAATSCRVCGRKAEWVCPDAPDEKTYEQPGHCDDCGVTLVRKEKK